MASVQSQRSFAERAGARKKGEAEKMSGKEQVHIQLFHKWDASGITVNDPGLKKVISLKPAVIPVTFGRHEHQRLKKAEVNIVERLANKMMHFGKKYAKNNGRMGGKKARMINIIETGFYRSYLDTGKNLIELLVRAIEISSPNEDTTRIVYGCVVYLVSVDVAPLRRVDLALRVISEGVNESI